MNRAEGVKIEDIDVNLQRKPLMAVENAFLSKASYNETPIRSNSRGISGKTKGLAGELNNISGGVTPFNKSESGISVQEVIELSQKAYWNVSIYRMTIDIMTEFCNSAVHWRGGNASSRAFFKKWYKKINGWNLGDQFFREWFRSANIFLYRLDGIMELTGGGLPRRASIPIRYIMLNPADIRCDNSATFVNAIYNKVFNQYELERLKNPKTQTEIDLKNSLPRDVIQKINAGDPNPGIRLKQENLHAIFCKKQDYEPLAVPLFFPVLFDINLKLEFKKAEQVIARTVDYIILLITMGAEEEKGGVNMNVLNAMNELFQTESVGRVLVADYTTKINFVIPDLNKILGPEKYKAVNEDISSGMLNLFFGEDKFANSMIKIKIFLERLKEARTAYLNNFLIPEVERISQELGFKSYPEPEFEKVDLRDDVEYYKIYNRLAELGFLTPEETLEAYQTNQLPSPEDSLKSQEELKKQREEGLYMPITTLGKEAGRPDGSTAPQTTKNVSPVGASRNFSFEKLKDVISLSSTLINDVEAQYRESFSIKRINKKHKASILAIAKTIMANQPVENWKKSISEYIKGGGEINEEFSSLLSEIEEEHKVTEMPALLLLHSIVEEKCNE